jgi:hypothetical protein
MGLGCPQSGQNPFDTGAGHVLVEDDQVDPVARRLEHFQHGGAVSRREDAVATLFEDGGGEAEHGRVILTQKDRPSTFRRRLRDWGGGPRSTH